jgi:hypothetical protein
MKNLRTIYFFPLLILLLITQNCTSEYSQSGAKEIFSPGTAKIIGVINSIEPSGENLLVNITVTKIIGYGAASSPIPTNSNLLAIAINGEVKTKASKSVNTDSLVIELKLFQGGVAIKDSAKWEMIHISKNK